MSITGKNTKSIRKKDLKESRSKATGFTKLTFAHKAVAGETGIDLGSLVTPTEMASLGFTNPTSGALLEAKLFQFQDNLRLQSSLRGTLMKDLAYRVVSNSRISFEGFTAEEGEIFTGTLDSNPVNGISVVDAQSIIRTGTLLAGQTDVNVGTPFELNKFPGEQMGAVRLYIDGVLQTRNSNNSDTNQDGNYYEFGSQGIATILRVNNTDVQDRSYVVISNEALTEPPRDSAFAAIEKVSGQVDALIPTVSALAGVPVTDFQAAPSNADLKVFGDRVIGVEQATLEDPSDASQGIKLATVSEFGAIRAGKYQVKVLSSNAAAPGVVNDLSFNNLVPGRTYIYILQAYLAVNTGGSNGDVAANVVHNGSIEGGCYHLNAGGDAGETRYTSETIFTATTTTVTVEMAGANSFAFMRGNNTKSFSFGILIEAEYLKPTTDFT
jgi:hypothetical protein